MTRTADITVAAGSACKRRKRRIWGACRLGRIPTCIRADDGPTLGEANQDDLRRDGDRYKARFNRVFQHFQVRCQHHTHRNNAKGVRIVPNACRSISKPNECKRGAPWTSTMNTDRPLLICKGIARDRKLPSSGARDMVNRVMGLRNNEWVNGTSPGLCVAFAGSNTDVRPNDLLPVIKETHEGSACKRECFKRSSLRKVIRKAQRAQATTNGYFGGYIGKRQPAGKLETKKCVHKMHILRGRMEGKSQQAQERAASARMITDLEMGSTLRGAVELFNLAKNLRRGDVLFAECVRTFSNQDVDARAWLHRLEVELQRLYLRVHQCHSRHCASAHSNESEHTSIPRSLWLPTTVSAMGPSITIRVHNVLAGRAAARSACLRRARPAPAHSLDTRG